MPDPAMTGDPFTHRASGLLCGLGTLEIGTQNPGARPFAGKERSAWWVPHALPVEYLSKEREAVV